MIFKDFAPLYTNKGYPVIPVNGKIPIIKEWQRYCTEYLDEFKFCDWLGSFPNAGIGIPMGPAANATGFDIDIHSTLLGEQIFNYIKDLLPYSRIEKKGQKCGTYFFSYNGETSEKLLLGTELILENGKEKEIHHGIDLLSLGRQTVVPPSIHPTTGLPYTWVNEPLYEVKADNLPPLPPGVLNKIKERMVSFPGQRFYKKEHEKSESVGRNDKLTEIAWAMCERGEPVDKIINELLIVDSRNIPPLFTDQTENQMRGKTREENAKRFAVSVVNSWAKYYDKKYEPAPDVVIDFNHNRVEPEFGTANYKFNNLYNLLKNPIPEPKWLWEGIIPEVGLCIPAGPPKCGKSTLIRQLVTAMGEGESMFKRKVTKGSVLYLSFEEGLDNVLRQFLKMGAENAKNTYLHVGFPPDPNLDQLSDIIKEKDIKLVVVDTLINIMGTDKLNDYGVVYPILNKLVSFCHKNQVCVMGVHHTNKAGDGSAAIMGSTAFRAACETMILMDHDEETEERTISTLQRTGDSLPTTLLDYDPDTNLLELDLTPKKAENLEIDTKILDVIRLSGPVSQKGIKDKSGYNKMRISRSLVRLLGSLKVRRKGSGSSKDPYLYEINHFTR